MKVTSLINKLAKLDITPAIVHTNEFNKRLVFNMNGKTFEADFDADDFKVNNYCITFEYDEANQNTRRRFFDTFRQVMAYSIGQL